MITDKTPKYVEIKRRDINFDLDALDRYYFGNHAYKTHFMNALSTLFPIGEGQFIKSVMNFKDYIQDEQRLEDVKEFVGQEGAHSREHRRLNQLIGSLGYDLEPLNEDMNDWAKTESAKPVKKQLAKTICLEHFTALMANSILKNNFEIIKDMQPRIKAVWVWHAVEETEHKAVAFNVYNWVGGGYLMRVITMLQSTREIMMRIRKRTKYFLKADKGWTIKNRWEGLKFQWGKKGILSSSLLEYFKFFRVGFHPWDINNYYLIEDWKNRYAEDNQSVLYM
jgi:predicted metal-dependent hydrolase